MDTVIYLGPDCLQMYGTLIIVFDYAPLAVGLSSDASEHR